MGPSGYECRQVAETRFVTRWLEHPSLTLKSVPPGETTELEMNVFVFGSAVIAASVIIGCSSDSTAPAGGTEGGAGAPAAGGAMPDAGAGTSTGGGSSSGGASSGCTAGSCGAGVCDVASGQCVECVADGDCSGANHFCNADKVCIECKSNSDCGSNQVCNTGPGDCTESCTTTADCAGAYPVCDTQKKLCVECTSNADCAGSAPDSLCYAATSECKQCLTSADCSGATPVCDQGHSCVAR